MKQIIIMTSFVLGSGACAQEEVLLPPVSQSPPTAVINGQPILEEQFEEFISLNPDELESDSSGSRRNLLFREFVTEQLLLQEAEKEGISVAEREVQRHLDGWLSEGQEATPVLRERVRTLLKIQKFVKQEIGDQIQVGNQEMFSFYRSRGKEYIINDQAHVLELLLEDREKAEEIHSQLSVGDARSFKELARTFSKGLTAESGGNLGSFERGQLPEDFEKTIFKLKPGEISPVFRSAEGYHIFMMEEWVPRHAQKFYEVQDSIFEKLVADKERVALDLYVEQLVRNASVEIHDEDLALQWGDSRASLQ
ncbi:MAG: peptidylprolyl isomerase [Acidobacteriota bacterium]